MKHSMCALITAVCVSLLSSTSHAQVRISYTGGWYDETACDTAYIYLEALRGEMFQGSPWRINFWSMWHELWGWNPDLEDTEAYYLCPDPTPLPEETGNYNLEFWFEPGSLAIGNVTGRPGYDQNCYVIGNRWEGHVPLDFTGLRIQFYMEEIAGYPACTREWVVPIVWTMEPVPTKQETWGSVKNKYEKQQ